MPHPVRKITIEGFRGILSRLELDFVRQSRASSMILYGSNGTGKSSITDAWEWFFTENIQHLRREGAAHAAFCHNMSDSGNSYVEIEFSESSPNAVRLTYDHNKITKPVVAGNISGAKALAPHPCQIRFGDLTRFVYLTKSDRFDELAKFMGFVPQVEYLKALRRTARKFAEKLSEKQRSLAEEEEALKRKLDLRDFSEQDLWRAMANILNGVGVKCDEDIDSVTLAVGELKGQVTEDQTAQRLSLLKFAVTLLAKMEIPANLMIEYGSYVDKANELIAEQESLQKLVLADLYSAAEIILKAADDRTVCPLCGEKFKGGDLYIHVTEQHGLLDEIIKKQTALEQVCGRFDTIASDVISSQKSIEELTTNLNGTGFDDRSKVLVDSLRELHNELTKAKTLVSAPVKTIAQKHVTQLENEGETLRVSAEKFEGFRKSAKEALDKAVSDIETDSPRKRLVDAHSVMTWCSSSWEKMGSLKRSIAKLQSVGSEFDTIVQDYVDESAKDVDTRFQLISQDVAKYFEILEQHTSEIGSAKLVLVPDQDRSVELEVVFHGETIKPAYKYLSESQLNSFGLAVFLASARHFNRDFKFVILDDIINSFDAYKRPQVITLLQEEFADFQVLLLTHDEVWRDRLYRAMPSWARTEFYDYAPSRGPLQRDGMTEIERIQELLREDRPTEAGRDLGPYMEQQLQGICESFEVSLKYNRRNEYTLEPLFVALRSRIEKKLRREHALYRRLELVWQDSGFRNYCAHWKESSSIYTKTEIDLILSHWLDIERLVYCPIESCGQLLKYDGQGAFVCPCEGTRLEKNVG